MDVHQGSCGVSDIRLPLGSSKRDIRYVQGALMSLANLVLLKQMGSFIHAEIKPLPLHSFHSIGTG